MELYFQLVETHKVTEVGENTLIYSSYGPDP